MKKFILFLAVIGVALAAPAVAPEEDDILEQADNSTRAYERRPLGFGSFGGGTVGGQGGAVFTVFDPWALRDALDNNQRRIVYLRGRVDLSLLFVSNPGVRLRIGSYTSLIGGDRNAEIFGGGVVVSGVRQVIIQNIKINNALSYMAGERPDGNGGILNMQNADYSTIDNIGIDRNSEHVWVDHCEFSDDPWVAGQGRRRHDGLIDITLGSSLITVSNSIFRNHVFTSLVGNGADVNAPATGRLKVTWFANWFRGTGQRNPYVSVGENHILNNLYTDIGDFAIGAGMASSVYVERNTFINCRRNRGAISSNRDPRGQILEVRNTFRNCNFDVNLPSNVRWNPSQYYNYRAIPMGDVENHVRRYAGVW